MVLDIPKQVEGVDRFGRVLLLTFLDIPKVKEDEEKTDLEEEVEAASTCQPVD